MCLIISLGAKVYTGQNHFKCQLIIKGSYLTNVEEREGDLTKLIPEDVIMI